MDKIIKKVPKSALSLAIIRDIHTVSRINGRGEFYGTIAHEGGKCYNNGYANCQNTTTSRTLPGGGGIVVRAGHDDL